MPEFLDAVQLWAIGWQKVEGDPPPPKDFEVGLNGPRSMKAGVVENDRQRFIDLRAQQAEEANEEQGIDGTPQGDADDLTRGEEGADHIQPFASAGLNRVLLANGGPGTPIRVNLGEAHFIQVGQRDLTGLRLLSQGGNLLFCLRKFHVIPFFLNYDGCVSRRIHPASTPR